MGKWIKSNILDIIQIAALVGAGVIGIIVWLQRVPWYFVVLGMLFAVVLILVGINQYAAFRERRKKGLTKLSDKELEGTVREWLDVPAFKVQRRDPESGVSFAFDITLGALNVYLERHEKEPLVLQFVGVSPTSVQNKAMSESDWGRLTGQLSIEMARLGIQFGFEGLNKRERIMLIESVILDDSLTGYYFRSRVMFVIRALILVQEVAKNFFREIP